MYEIIIKNISFAYSRNKQSKFKIKRINYRISTSKAIGLLGSNGSGKTTLIKLILGLLSPMEGEIFINNKKILGIKSTKEIISFVPENAKLFLIGPTAREDISRIIHDESIVDNLLISSKINENADKKLYHLSEGQRRIYAIFNSFQLNRSIYIFDEPTIGLDKNGRQLFLDLISKAKLQDKIIIVATNDSRLFSHFDELMVLEKGSLILSGNTNEVLYQLELKTKILPNQIVRLIQKLETKSNKKLPHFLSVEEFNQLDF